MSIPGISYLTAHLLLCEIGDIQRFPTAKRLCSYAGIVPGTHQSADRIWHGPIAKQGHCYIRWAMVEAVQKALVKDPVLAIFYRKLQKEKGAAKARVAVARKLLVAVYNTFGQAQELNWSLRVDRCQDWDAQNRRQYGVLKARIEVWDINHKP
jgi:transposase